MSNLFVFYGKFVCYIRETDFRMNWKTSETNLQKVIDCTLSESSMEQIDGKYRNILWYLCTFWVDSK